MPYKKKKFYRKKGSVSSKVNYLMKRDKQNKIQALSNRNYAQYGVDTTSQQSSAIQRITAIDGASSGPATRPDLNISLSSLFYRYALIAADTTNVIRILIIQAKGSYSATSPTSSDIYRTASGGSSVDCYRAINTDAFHVLVDRLIPVSTNGEAVKVVQGEFAKFGKKHLAFNTTATNTCTAGDIFFVHCSDSGAVSHPSISGFIKLKYYA